MEAALTRLENDTSLIYSEEYRPLKEHLMRVWGVTDFGPEPEPGPSGPGMTADIPRPAEEAPGTGGQSQQEKEQEMEQEMEEEEEEEVTFDDPEVLQEPDNDPPPPMGDPAAEVTDADLEKQAEARAAAQELLSEGKYEDALDKWNQVIEIRPSPLLYAKRAEVFLILKKPNAAIRDCTAALSINPDSAKSFKVRGKAYRMLGDWERSAHDLQEGNRIDFDEETFEVEKLVDSRWHIIRTQRLRKLAKVREKEAAARRERAREAAKAHAEAARRAAEETENSPSGGGFGGMPPFSMDEATKERMKDPAVQEKLTQMLADLQSNPMNALKYMSDPDLAPILQGLMGQFAGGMDGMGGMGGMGASDPTAGAGGFSASAPPFPPRMDEEVD
uniref:STI1/HOP DP domain-containing protein n=1 Tax=Compsopogon caeruleus TaxID=31354 RepID=A0A7S1XCA8_9RHOD